MHNRRTADPAFEPISIDDILTHSRIDNDVERAYVGMLIRVAREHVEDVIGQSLLGTTWELTLDEWPCGPLVLPRCPLRAVASIIYTDQDGNTNTVDSASYSIDLNGVPGRLALAKTTSHWPFVILRSIGGIKIAYTAGYSDVLASNAASEALATARAACPAAALQAIKLIAAHLYENREEVVIGSGLTATQVPIGAFWLLQPLRSWVY